MSDTPYLDELVAENKARREAEAAEARDGSEQATVVSERAMLDPQDVKALDREREERIAELKALGVKFDDSDDSDDADDQDDDGEA